MVASEGSFDIVKFEGGAPALAKPEFIIAVDGKYYRTVAVWEYDPHSARTDEQKHGVAKISENFRDLRNKGWERVAVQSPPEQPIADSAQHTFP